MFGSVMVMGLLCLASLPVQIHRGQAEESSDLPLMSGHRIKATPLDVYSRIMRSEGKDLFREYWVMYI